METAIRWLITSAEHGNQLSQYTLGKLYLLGKDAPRDKETATQLLHYLSGIFREQEPPPSRSGGMRIAVDKKRVRKIREKKMAQGHKGDDHEAQMTF